MSWERTKQEMEQTLKILRSTALMVLYLQTGCNHGLVFYSEKLQSRWDQVENQTRFVKPTERITSETSITIRSVFLTARPP